MKIIKLSLLFTIGAVLIIFSCAKNSNTNSYTANFTGSYSGVYSSEVKLILANLKSYRNYTFDVSVPPSVSVATNCIRDNYIASAIQSAWLAEGYARSGNNVLAIQYANAMNNQILAACNLCSASPSLNATNCNTFDIFPCDKTFCP